MKVDADTWLAARCAGPGYRIVRHHDEWRRGIMAHTSPVYVSCGGDYWRFDARAASYMLTLIDRGADLLVGNGSLGADAADALRREARRRAQAGEFFGHMSFVSAIARKPKTP